MNVALPTTFSLKRWILATFLGWLLGVVLIILLSSLLDSIGIQHMQFYVGVGMGAGVGFTQWLLLRKYLRVSVKWVFTSFLGLGIPFVVLDLLLREHYSWKLPLCVALGGIITGWMQASLLSGYFRKTFAWIIASFAGWTLATLTVLLINYSMSIKVSGSLNLLIALINLLIILSGGVILGFVTGKSFHKMQSPEQQ